MRRLEFLEIAAALFLWVAASGCDNSYTRPQTFAVPTDLPVSVRWKFNETELVDSTTVIRVPPKTPVLVTGELLPNPGVTLSRHPMGSISPSDFNIPMIPLPKNIGQPFTDKPDDIHIYLWLALSYSGRDRSPEKEKMAGDGFINQLVGVDRKNLIFSGGIMSPENPGTYALRLWGSFKTEKECTTNRDRSSVGTPKFVREVTLIVNEKAN